MESISKTNKNIQKTIKTETASVSFNTTVLTKSDTNFYLMVQM